MAHKLRPSDEPTDECVLDVYSFVFPDNSGRRKVQGKKQNDSRIHVHFHLYQDASFSTAFTM